MNEQRLWRISLCAVVIVAAVVLLAVQVRLLGTMQRLEGALGEPPGEVQALAWGDYFKSVQTQLAMLLSGTEEDATAIPDRKMTLDGESVDVTTSVDFTVTLDSEVVSVDATGQGDVPITLDGEAVDVTTSVDFTVTLDSEVVTADVTGQGDVPITLDGEAVDVTTSVDFTVTLDSEVVAADVTGQGDVPITLDGEAIDTELAAAAALADAATNPTVPKVGAAQLLYNATTVNANWDRERNNWAEWPFPSAQYTASSWVQLVNYNARGAYLVVNITGIGVDQSLTVSAQVYDYDGAGSEASDQQETIWSSAALTPTGRHTYLIYPGAGAAAQDVVATVSYPLPRLFNVSATLNNSEPITFSIGVHYIN